MLIFLFSFLFVNFCYFTWETNNNNNNNNNKLQAGGRHNMPRPSSPSVGAEAPRAAELAVPAECKPQRSSRFPRPIRSHAHRCSCLTRPNDLDLLILRVVSESRATWATSVPNFSLPSRPLCSRLRPDVRDRQTDVRQHHRLMPLPIRGGA